MTELKRVNQMAQYRTQMNAELQQTFQSKQPSMLAQTQEGDDAAYYYHPGEYEEEDEEDDDQVWKVGKTGRKKKKSKKRIGKKKRLGSSSHLAKWEPGRSMANAANPSAKVPSATVQTNSG